MSCGIGYRRGLDPIQPLAWEPPYAAEAALEKAKGQNNNNNNNK